VCAGSRDCRHRSPLQAAVSAAWVFVAFERVPDTFQSSRKMLVVLTTQSRLKSVPSPFIFILSAVGSFLHNSLLGLRGVARGGEEMEKGVGRIGGQGGRGRGSGEEGGEVERMGEGVAWAVWGGWCVRAGVSGGGWGRVWEGE